MSKEPYSVIHWFRRGLRLHDNAALLEALKPINDGDRFILRPVYIIDPWYKANVKCGQNRTRFLLQSLQDLDNSLRKLGSSLYVARGDPVEVFEKLFTKWEVKKITWEVNTEPYARERDRKVSSVAKMLKVKVTECDGHTLYNLDFLLSKNNGNVPLTQQKFTSLVTSIGHPAKPQKAPECLKKFAPSSEVEKELELPSHDEFYLDESASGKCLFPGGETEALKRLEEKICFENAKWVREFEKPLTSPNSLEPSTTVLSPYVTHGCLSSRTFYWKLFDVYEGAKHSKPPVSLKGQLFWREFFYTVGAHTENFDKMVGNKICRQIPWESNEEKLNAWKNSQTGFPFIDAVMTQLREEGWIHHLARHSVACFLTRGDFWQSWEKGKEVFEEYLLDHDWSLNAGNWMWMSASAFFHHYYRVYSPVAFGKKTDPTGAYIRKYLPQLEKFPNEFIYEPWKAPLSVQKDLGVIIGVDYPKPIVDHGTASKQNITKMKAAFAAASKAKAQNDADFSPPSKKKSKLLE
ncbi:cryptochrome-2-like [Symsagittifera roscoffensis]|uniref:cryptochrome-2-like n=1 Tax=Symsagittifera roscoffensis TaxID=84072 RepID=UPI00307C9FD2